MGGRRRGGHILIHREEKDNGEWGESSESEPLAMEPHGLLINPQENADGSQAGHFQRSATVTHAP